MSENVIKIDANNFETEVVKSELPVLIDFWAEWCGPCKMLAPSVDKLAESFKGTIKVGKINIDEDTTLAARFKVMSIPTLVLLKNGEAKASVVGNRPYDALEKFVKENI